MTPRARKAKPKPQPPMPEFAAIARAPWLDRRLPGFVSVLLGLGLLLAPLWLFADAFGWFYAFDPFGSFPILGDDFPYLAESRTRSALLANLFTPHNAHIVPLFRIWIHVLGTLAGSLEGLPVALGAGSFLVLALVLLAAGHLVFAETRRVAIALGSMAILGVSTVVEPASAWFSAGQALWAALMTLGMLIMLHDWRRSGGLWRLILASMAAIAAPAFWSGGYAAVPTGLAYLWSSGILARDRTRASIALVLPVMVLGLGFWVVSARSRGPSTAAGPPVGSISRVFRGIGHTAQAIPEVLILGNLGLEAETSAGQGVILSLAIGLLWAWTRRGRGSIRPLEASGATLLLTSFLLAFVFRGGYEYSSLRGLGWYHAMPQVGGVLFAAGWWSATRDSETATSGLRRRDGLGILILVVALLVIHDSRARSFFLGRLPAPGSWERQKFPIPVLQRDRGIYLQSERVEWLRRSLARLDRLEALARRIGASREAIRRSSGAVYLPTWPEAVTRPDALDLLDLPIDGPDLDPRNLAAIREWLQPLPEPRPKYLPPAEPWPSR